MKLNQLEYFCAVCRYHSITRAAEELFVTQPTISVAIRELEKEFHLKLFQHGKNRISLTQEGEAFYKRAEALVRESHAISEEFSSLGHAPQPLRIGIPPLIGTVFFPYLHDQFQKKTGIPVQLLEYGSVRACGLVQSEELDIALVNMDFYNIEQFNSSVLMEDAYVYCVGKGHRFAGKKELAFDMLEDEKIILFNTDSVQNETVRERYRAHGLTPDVLMYCSQLYTILEFLRSGDCGAFLFDSLPVDEDAFVKIPLRPEIPCTFGAVWKKGVFIPTRTERFIEFIRSHGNRACV